MAQLHPAELRPSKLELIGSWAPHQSWFFGDANAELTSEGAFRFDDPEGEVGVETILVRAGTGPTLHVPLTYRDSPLMGAEKFLLGTMDHSVLGKRWVYDGVGDPVYFLTLTSTVLSGGRHADMFVEMDGKRIDRNSTAQVSGTGSGNATVRLPLVAELDVHNDGELTVIDTSAMQVCVVRVLHGKEMSATGANAGSYRTAESLAGTWESSSDAELLAVVRHN